MISQLLMLLQLILFVDASIQHFHKADPSIQSLGTQKMQKHAVTGKFLNRPIKITRLTLFFQQCSPSVVTNSCNHEEGILQIVLSFTMLQVTFPEQNTLYFKEADEKVACDQVI